MNDLPLPDFVKPETWNLTEPQLADYLEANPEHFSKYKHAVLIIEERKRARKRREELPSPPIKTPGVEVSEIPFSEFEDFADTIPAPLGE